MKKFFAAVIVSILFSVNAFAATKIDPTFNYIKFQKSRVSAAELQAKFAAVKLVGATTMVKCMVKTNNISLIKKKIAEFGGNVGVAFETVLTAEIPLNAVEKLAAIPDVLYIEASKELRPKMNVARDDGLTNVVSVQSGTGLPQAYDGEGSVVGVIDSGIDCSHPDFFDASGSSRIVAFKNMSTGKEYTESEIADGLCGDSDIHGTHVTGIAAGGDSTYKGVAPGASIVGVSGSSTETEILEGISYIFQKAQAGLLPAVVNISLGTSIGPHDNTSTFETGINEALSGKVGRAVVCAAGNETVPPGDVDPPHILGGLHAGINVAAGAAKGYEMIERQINSSTTIDIWLASGSDCTIELDVFDDVGTRLIDMTGIAPGESNYLSPEEAGNISAYVDFTDNVNPNNGKQHAQAVLDYSSSSPYNPTELTYDLVFRSTGSEGCTGDAWLYIDYVSFHVFTDRDGDAGPDYTYGKGDSNKMITVPATASGCITVASYSSRPTWTDKDGNINDQESYNPNIGALGTTAFDLSTFSSHGPGAGSTNTQKPDVASPGEPLISTLNSACDTDSCLASLTGSTATDAAKRVADTSYRHLKLEGTSMATPFITGVVALLFERDGCLTPSQVRSAIRDESIADAFTGAVPNYLWGYGKVDALASIESFDPTECQPDNPSDNPAGGKSGCSLSTSQSPKGTTAAVIIFLLSLLPILIKKISLQNL